jgi:hypothetical protein
MARIKFWSRKEQDRCPALQGLIAMAELARISRKTEEVVASMRNRTMTKDVYKSLDRLCRRLSSGYIPASNF